jgi:hypothetical protein
VPLDVIGEPETARKDGTDAATLVTVPMFGVNASKAELPAFRRTACPAPILNPDEISPKSAIIN